METESVVVASHFFSPFLPSFPLFPLVSLRCFLPLHPTRSTTVGSSLAGEFTRGDTG